jgi:ribosomal protein S3AE
MRLPRTRPWRLVAWWRVEAPVTAGDRQVAEVLAGNRRAWVERELRDCVVLGTDEGARLRALVHGAQCTCHRCR